MLEAWRSLHAHGRMALSLGSSASAGRHRKLSALGERHIFEISHGGPICGPATKMLSIGSLHVCYRRVIQEVGALLRGRNAWRGRKNFRHAQQTGGRADRASTLGLALGTLVGNGTNTDLLHQSQ